MEFLNDKEHYNHLSDFDTLYMKKHIENFHI